MPEAKPPPIASSFSVGPSHDLFFTALIKHWHEIRFVELFGESNQKQYPDMMRLTYIREDLGYLKVAVETRFLQPDRRMRACAINPADIRVLLHPSCFLDSFPAHWNRWVLHAYGSRYLANIRLFFLNDLISH
jgi:hypothetical protein